MAKKQDNKKKTPAGPDKEIERVVSENRKARFEYEILDSLECGLVLHGSEVKSLRQAHVSIEEAYARVIGDEVWLVGADIPPYKEASLFNHEPKRPRKLLLHRREIRKFASKAYETGLTLVPLKLYFKKGKAKLLLGLGRGKKLHDKRESLKKADARRDIQRAMRRR
jgi:SsrA-binding protein